MRRISRIVVTSGLVIVLLIVEIIIIRSASNYQSRVSIVFAKADIPEGTVIQEDMLDIIEIDANIVQRNAVRGINEAVGKEAGMDMEEGEMVLAGKLRTAGEAEEIKVIDKENRLFSVEFKSDQVNGWQLLAGQYVDIIFVQDEGIDLQIDKMEGHISTSIKGIDSFEYSQSCPGVQLLRNIRVAALIDEQGRVLKGENESMTPRFISFEVSEKQDEFLAWAKSHGRLELSVIQK